LLNVDRLDAWYDTSHVVQGLSFHVMPGEIVTLMGRNGAGKTTTLKTIMGLISRRAGSESSAARRTRVFTSAWPTYPKTAASCPA